MVFYTTDGIFIPSGCGCLTFTAFANDFCEALLKFDAKYSEKFHIFSHCERYDGDAEQWVVISAHEEQAATDRGILKDYHL